MKIEFEIDERFTDYDDPKIKMVSILSGLAKILLSTTSETIYDVKIDGENASIY